MTKYLLFFTVAGSFALAVQPACADDAALPGKGFDASHYESLWTKSPFSVATPDAVEDSPDYTLVGITQLEGVAYVSVVDAHNGDHFVVSSEQPIKGLKLMAITRSHNGTDTYATVQKDGQPLTLKLQAAPATPAAAGTNPGGQPPIMVPPVTQNIPMPGAGNPPPVYSPGVPPGGSPMQPRSIRVHRPTIHLPPMPANQQPAPGTPPPADSSGGQQPVQTHAVPPSQ